MPPVTNGGFRLASKAEVEFGQRNFAAGDPDAFAHRTLALAKRSGRLIADHQALGLPRVRKNAVVHEDDMGPGEEEFKVVTTLRRPLRGAGFHLPGDSGPEASRAAPSKQNCATSTAAIKRRSVGGRGIVH
jgi:hypothetical protein